EPGAEARGGPGGLRASMLPRGGGAGRRQGGLFAGAAGELGGQRELQAREILARGLPIVPDLPMTEHLRWVDRALAVARQAGDPRLEVLVLGNASGVLVYAGDPRWRPVAERIRQITEGAPRRHREAQAHYAVGVQACPAGHLQP